MMNETFKLFTYAALENIADKSRACRNKTQASRPATRAARPRLRLIPLDNFLIYSRIPDAFYLIPLSPSRGPLALEDTKDFTIIVLLLRD